MDKETYSKYLSDPRWREKRQEVLEQHNFQCDSCKTKKNLQIHHKEYLPNRMPWDYSQSYYKVLCEKCHAMEHGLVYMEKKCKVCGISISTSYEYCFSCHKNLLSKIEEDKRIFESEKRRLEESKRNVEAEKRRIEAERLALGNHSYQNINIDLEKRLLEAAKRKLEAEKKNFELEKRKIEGEKQALKNIDEFPIDENKSTKANPKFNVVTFTLAAIIIIFVGFIIMDFKAKKNINTIKHSSANIPPQVVETPTLKQEGNFKNNTEETINQSVVKTLSDPPQDDTKQITTMPQRNLDNTNKITKCNGQNEICSGIIFSVSECVMNDRNDRRFSKCLTIIQSSGSIIKGIIGADLILKINDKSLIDKALNDIISTVDMHRHLNNLITQNLKQGTDIQFSGVLNKDDDNLFIIDLINIMQNGKLQNRQFIFTIQVAAFTVYRNAQRVKVNFGRRYINSHINEYTDSRGTFYRVRVGRFRDLDTAERFYQELTQSGIAAKYSFVVAETKY